MVINRKSWHTRLYMLAWLFDRGWFEWLFFPNPLEREMTDLDREWAEADCQVRAAYPHEWIYKSPEERLEIQARAEPLIAKRDELKKKLERLEKWWVLRIVAERRIAAKKRFQSGKLALCPYFWSVVLAITVYLPLKAIGWVIVNSLALIAGVSTTAAHYIAWPFVHFGAWLGERIRRNQEKIEFGLAVSIKGLLGLSIVTLVLMVGYVIYSNVEQWPADRERALMRETVSRQEQATWRVLEAERAARKQAEWKAWLKTPAGLIYLANHQERMEQMKADAEARRLAYEADSKRREAEWNSPEAQREQRIAQAQDVAYKAQKAAGDTIRQIEGDISSYANWALFFSGLVMLCGVVFILTGLVELWRRFMAPRPKVQAVIVAIGNGWQHLKTWWAETKELIKAFAKARKEKVCPYIEFIDDGQPHS